MQTIRILVLALACAALTGCRKPEPPPAEPIATTVPGIPTKAQPRLPTVQLYIGAQTLTAEVATTAEQVQTGMMFRTNVLENEGMLFVFGFPHRASFWMKNCPVDLSAAYINPDGVILEIHPLEKHNTNSVVAASDNVQFVLETARGWFERNNITPGTLIRTERGSLKETFFAR